MIFRDIYYNYTVIILFVLVIVVMLGIGCKYVEHFSTSVTVVTSNVPNYNNWIQTYSKKTYAIKNTEEPIKWFTIQRNIQTISDGSVYLIADPLDYLTYFSNYKVITKCPTGYFIAFTNAKTAFQLTEFDCTFNLANKTIGYFDNTDLYMIKAIAISHRIDTMSYALVKLSKKNFKIADLENSNIDFVITFVVPDSSFHKFLMSLSSVSFLDFGSVDITRIKMVYPNVFISEKKLKHIFPNGLILSTVSSKPLLATNALLIETSVSVGASASVGASVGTEKFTNFTFNPTTLDPTYKCYGDSDTNIRALCDSPFDVSGQPKNYYTKWEKACTTNNDCPFYKKNIYYPNERGGCDSNGMCELPIGVRRTGFMSYSDNPFCYGCDNPIDPSCCKHRPDYAFSNDFDERKKYGLNTTLVKLN